MGDTRQRILQFIKDYVEQHKYAPTVQEIGEGVGLKAVSAVHWHLRKMLDAGMIETDHPGAPRAIRVPREKE